ncbi:MAG: tryptophan--tRNA ligase [Phycisphaerales bacterium]|jgi:tryptophanyl-tRNA synthetase|nr:tryptophan--tRNA ligase [Phycisphaerales bacterium]
MSDRQVILTGDTPTGQLHLGHFVGSVRRRLELQETCDCFFLLANMHAFTTRSDDPAGIRGDTLEIVRDYLAMGIDPAKAAIVLQTEVPAIAELTYFFAMLLPFNRVMRNPTLKEEIRVKDLGDTYSFGFPLYAVGQTADILVFRAHSVPVGEDQVPHIELTREVARRFNKMYCGVPEDVEDDDPIMSEKGIFPIPLADVGRVGRLVGTDGVNKMGKSLNNAIYLTDSPKQVKKKLGQLYTGRQSMTDPGDPDNGLMQWLETFVEEERAAEVKDRYVRGDNIGDGHVKAEIAEAISTLLEPMQERRARYDGDDDTIIDILRDGTARANAVAEETLALAKEAADLGFFRRSLSLK